VTSKNIANVNAPGYAKESVTLEIDVKDPSAVTLRFPEIAAIVFGQE
jgi:flagellar basal body rod protein FlgB